jgi:ABC-type transport system substrate-binding protein
MPASLAPGDARGGAAALLGGLVHQTLLGIDPDGLPVPALIEGWTAAADGREWRLRLRDAATFHDGRAVTSGEALAAVRRFLASGSPAGAWMAAALDPATPASVPDGQHLILRFREARALPLAPLAAPAAAVTGARGSGCGPFVPLAPAPGKRIRLSAFAGHVRGRPYLDAVDVVAVAVLEAEFRTGKVDVFPGEGPVTAVGATLMLALDSRRPPFDRLQARASVAGAVDRADIVKRLLPGGDAAPSLLVPGLLPPVASPPPARGPGLAAAVRMAVGADVPPLVSQRIVASLGAVGLRVDARAVPPAQVAATPASARLFLWSPEVAEAGLALRELAALVPRSAAVNDALAAAAAEHDPDRRRALLHRAEAELRARSVLIPLASVPVTFHARPGVHDLRVELTGRLVLEDAWREP